MCSLKSCKVVCHDSRENAIVECKIRNDAYISNFATLQVSPPTLSLTRYYKNTSTVTPTKTPEQIDTFVPPETNQEDYNSTDSVDFS